MTSNSSVIGITMGDPAGVGPEVIAKALSQSSVARLARFIVIGDEAIYRRYSKKDHSNVTFLDCRSISIKDFQVGQVNVANGKAALTYLQKAVALLKAKKIFSVVTAPVSKEAIAKVLPKFQGHTEFLADSFGVKDVGMLFVADGLKTIIVTRHLPIKDVAAAINKKLVYRTIELTHEALKDLFKIKNPKIALCGLNPHAGEGGKIGQEEIKQIIPALMQAKKNGMDVRGPFPADTIFYPKIAKNYDVIVAMYHDQGLIGIKANYFDRLVNMTIGLPFVRTSPAHGTAFNIAGQNKADPASMIEAIRLAVQLS